MKRNLKVLCLLLFVNGVSFAQNPAIFKGGNGDGWDLKNFTQNSGNIFRGGNNDGWASQNFTQTTSSIFKGGNGDGWHSLNYMQPTRSIFKGGAGDGWSSLPSLQQSAGIFKGGIGDGWAGGYLTPQPIYMSDTSDYFRSVTTGAWNNPSTWESSPDNVTYYPATLSPDYRANTITIRANDVVTVTASVTTDKTFVNPLGALVTTASTLTVINNGLTLRSGANGTGRIGQSTGTITGNVTVERYIPANASREWRMLSIATATNESINASWQNGQAPGVTGPANKGTIITSSSADPTFDYRTPSNSMLTFNAATNAWMGIANTSLPIATDNGYMIWIRGDRTCTPNNSLRTPTILSTTGPLKQGAYPATAITAPAGQFMSIGNPYASQINFKNVTKSAGVDNTFYVWDPKLTGSNGFGAYQTMTLSGANYIITPGGGSYGASGSMVNTIESGQAFFVHATAGGTVSFTESAKSNGNRMVFRGSATPAGSLITNLYAIDAAGDNLADGTMCLFSGSYTNAVNGMDALKLTNFGISLGIMSQGKALAVEKRQLIANADTIMLNLAHAKKQRYRFDFIANGLAEDGLRAYLADSYLNTKTPVSLDGTTSVDFEMTQDSGTTVAGRFSIVFAREVKAPAPVVKAEILIYPNPVHNGIINLRFNNMDKGKYELMLFNTLGQAIYTRQLNRGEGTGTETISTTGFERGAYTLVVTKPGGTKVISKVIID